MNTLTKDELELFYQFINFKELDSEVNKETIVNDVFNYISVARSFKLILVNELTNFDDYCDYECESDNIFTLIIKLIDLTDCIIDDLVCIE